MTQKKAIVTGASSGFGLLITIELAKRGFHVYATMRNLQKTHCVAEAIPSEALLKNISFYPLDVTKQQSIQRFEQFVQSLDRVDVLVNNAGYAGAGFCEEIKVEDYRNQFETNVFGVMAVTQAVLPKMRAQQRGNIINVSSISGRVAFPGISPYVASKHALEGYSESLRLEMKPFGVHVALIEPGSYNTNIWTTGMQLSKRSNEANSPYRLYLQRIQSNLESSKKNRGNPLDVAQLIAMLADQSTIKKLRYPIGSGVTFMIQLKKVIPWCIWERIFLKRLNMIKK
ncbi:SDR family oxidoreductase [Pontibacillus litoralis]|uniref:Short-chain dehydrogenase n=1 Tax=Pontibacillus litoralis JSM 072002 TaxID=1385512 RepID=A0A0A5HN01_9BACI|nr:SDR family oxidoreductase [Pontibacillus litoralis]KGX84982.1 short-chain dehydrogenase [Pontibacillus litoralis JSM 072002]